MKSTAVALTLVAVVTAACSQVAPSPEALDKNIAALDAAGVAHCQLLSKLDLSAPTGSGVLERVPADVEQDLRNLAINQAAGGGADSVAPLSPMTGGKQTYGLYKCQGAVAAKTAAPQTQTTQAPAVSTVKTLPYNPPN